jgi:O-antigen/teichoic acid export membrane protein
VYYRNSIIKKLFIYGGGEILSKLISFLFLPFAAIFMDKGEFGTLSFIYPIIISGQGILTFGLGIGFLKYLTNKDYSNSCLSFCILVIWFFCNFILFLCVYGVINSPVFNNYTVGEYYITDVFLVSYLSASFFSFVVVFLQKYQAEGEALKYVVINTGTKLLFIIIIMFNLLMYDELTAIEAIHVCLFVNALFFIFCLVSSLKSSNFQLDITFSKNAIYIGFPIFVSGVVTLFSAFSGRVFLNNQFNITIVADFSLMLILSQSMLLIYTTYSRIYIPALFKKLNDSAASAKKMVELSIPILNLFGFYSVSIAYVLFLYIVNTYVDGFEFSPWIFGVLIASYIIYPIYIHFVDILSFNKRSKTLMYINISVMFYNIILSYILVLYFGIMGASIAFFSTMVIQSLSIYYFSSNLIKVVNMLKATFISLFLFSIVVIIVSFLNDSMLLLFFLGFIVVCCTHLYIRKSAILTLLKELR